MNELIKKYQNLVIYRQSLIMLIAAPIPAAAVKLQGTLLDPDTIALIIISANVFAMASLKLNRLSCKSLFVLGNSISILASGGILAMYLYGVRPEFIIVYFPIVSTLGFLLVGLASNQIKNLIKDKAGEDFNLAEYDAKKQSFVSGAAVVGQLMGVAFYMVVDVNPLELMIVLETINTVLYLIAELQRWNLIKEMKLLA